MTHLVPVRDARDLVRRIWERDASLWTGRDEAEWLGWLDAPDRELARVEVLLAEVARLPEHDAAIEAWQVGMACMILIGL